MSVQQEDTAGDGSVSSHFSCDVDSTSTREVRRLVRDVLRGRRDVMVDDAVLVADELVTNALLHAAGPRRCRVDLAHDGRRLRIEVDDAAPDRHPRLQTPDRSGGRGLVLLQRLTSAWGVQYHSGHKTVWAELALNRPGTSGNARHLTVVPTDRD